MLLETPSQFKNIAHIDLVPLGATLKYEITLM